MQVKSRINDLFKNELLAGMAKDDQDDRFGRNTIEITIKLEK